MCEEGLRATTPRKAERLSQRRQCRCDAVVTYTASTTNCPGEVLAGTSKLTSHRSSSPCVTLRPGVPTREVYTNATSTGAATTNSSGVASAWMLLVPVPVPPAQYTAAVIWMGALVVAGFVSTERVSGTVNVMVLAAVAWPGVC